MPLYLRELKNAALILAGILSAGLGIHGFLLESGLIDGGVTGISMLLSRVTGWPLAVLLPLVNLPFIIIGYRQLGVAFAVRGALAIAGLALALAFVHFPVVTADMVLDAVFGGFFLGAGIGLAVRGGAVLDGTEIAALLISRHSALVKVGDLILMFNVALFVIAMAVLGVEPALYSILTYMSAARTLDFIIHGIEEYTSITIMSDHNEFIRRRITGELGRGVTVYRARGGLSGDERDILYCVVTRLEVGRVNTIIRETDPRAFVILQPLADVQGGTVRRACPSLSVPRTGGSRTARTPTKPSAHPRAVTYCSGFWRICHERSCSQRCVPVARDSDSRRRAERFAQRRADEAPAVAGGQRQPHRVRVREQHLGGRASRR